MKRFFWFAMCLGLCAANFNSEAAPAQPKKLLVVSVAVGFRHSSIEVAEQVIEKMGKESGAFTVEIVRNKPRPQFKDDPEKEKKAQAEWMAETTKELADKLSLAALEKFDGVIFANTSGDLPLPDKEGFVNWIKSGKAFIGTHSASDTFHQFPPYLEMLGGEFRTHHAQATVEALNQDLEHPATKHIGPMYKVHDEIYLFNKFFRDRVHGLLWSDKHPNFGVPGDYPIAWTRTVDKGRVFYTSLGHREDVWQNQTFQQHLLGGIRWALGLEYGDLTPQAPPSLVHKDELRAGFMPLFNGYNLDGWKLRHPEGRQSWSVQNGMLINTVTDTTKLSNNVPTRVHGNDLVFGEGLRDFTIRYEYMTTSNSNSGLYLRGRYEIQINDDFASGKATPGGNGAIYNVAAPAKFVSKPPGLWQEVEATIRGNRITVILNGEKIHDNVEVLKPTGGELDAKVDDYGPIMLQGDHGDVAFRKIRIKPLK